jgi:tetratricopeptide (TPR) repeat protein
MRSCFSFTQFGFLANRSRAVATLCALACLWPAESFAQLDGISIGVVVIGTDSPSAQQAVEVGQVAKQGFSRNPRFSPVDVEGILNGGPSESLLTRIKIAEEALDRGMAGYDAFELEPALEAFSESAISFEQSIAVLEDFSQLVDVYRYQGATYALQGDPESAQRSFIQALVLDPDATLSDGRFPDTVQAIFEAARETVQEMPKGVLSVYAAPSAAEVWVDGVFRGSSPLEIEGMRQGRHYVRLVRDGYVTYGEAYDVRGTSDETMQVTLRPTLQLARYEQLTARLLAGDERAPSDLAALFKVDQLFWALVETQGENVQIAGTLTNGVTGEPLLTASRAFSSASYKFRVELESWLAENFRRSLDAPTSKGPGNQSTSPSSGESFLPDKPEGPPTPGILIAGYVVTPLSIVPLLVGGVAGIYSFYSWDYYRNQGLIFAPARSLLEMERAGIDNQIQTENADAELIFYLFGASAILADLSWIVSGIGFASGVTMIIIGLNEKAEIQDVLAHGTFLPAAARSVWLNYGPNFDKKPVSNVSADLFILEE